MKATDAQLEKQGFDLRRRQQIQRCAAMERKLDPDTVRRAWKVHADIIGPVQERYRETMLAVCAELGEADQAGFDAYERFLERAVKAAGK